MQRVEAIRAFLLRGSALPDGLRMHAGAPFLMTLAARSFFFAFEVLQAEYCALLLLHTVIAMIFLPCQGCELLATVLPK